MTSLVTVSQAPRWRVAFCARALAMAAFAGWTATAFAATLTAEQVVDRNVAARGGLQAWKAVHSMALTGKMDAGKVRPTLEKRVSDPRKSSFSVRNAKADARAGDPIATAIAQPRVVQLPFAMELARPRKMRLELQFQGHTAIQVYDGVQGWKLRPFLGRDSAEPYTREELALASQQQELDGYLIDHVAKGSSVALEGQEPVGGRNTYKLKVVLKSGEVRHVWVDAETFLEARVDGTRRMDGKLKTMMTTFGDYKPVNGLMVPHTLETSVEGVRDSQRILVEHVALNPTIADVRFSKLQ